MDTTASAPCPARMRRTIDLLGSKWSLAVLPQLVHAPMRSNTLRRRLDGVSQKVFTQTLRHLQAQGLVLRRAFGGRVPAVEYSLTPAGRSLAEAICLLDDWIASHGDPLLQAPPQSAVLASVGTSRR